MATAAGGAAAGWVATTYASPALRSIVEGKSAAALRAAGKDYYSSARSDVGVDGVAILPTSAAVFVQFAGASYVGALAVLKASAAVIQQDASGHGELVSIEAQQIVCLLSAAQCELSLSERCATISKDLAAACERGEARSSLPKPLPNDLAERRALLKECAKRCTESLRLEVKAAKRAQFMAMRSSAVASSPDDGSDEDFAMRCSRAGAAQMLSPEQRGRLAAVFHAIDVNGAGRVDVAALAPPLAAGDADALLAPLHRVGAVEHLDALSLNDFVVMVNARVGNDATAAAAAGAKRGAVGPAEARVAFWEEAIAPEPTLLRPSAAAAVASGLGAMMKPASLATLSSVTASKAFYRRGRAYALLGRHAEARREVQLAVACHARGGRAVDPAFARELGRIKRAEKAAAARERRVYRAMGQRVVANGDADDDAEKEGARAASQLWGCGIVEPGAAGRAASAFVMSVRTHSAAVRVAFTRPSTPEAGAGASATVKGTMAEGRVRAQRVGLVLSAASRAVCCRFCAMLFHFLCAGLCCMCLAREGGQAPGKTGLKKKKKKKKN